MDQRLVIRRVRLDDDAHLDELYRSLDLDARCRRFVGSTLPGPSFGTYLTTVGERGGARFVVEALERVGDDPRLVAEAGYEVLANGDGELAMAVAAPQRGHVEALLLDALLDAAADAGLPNLEADVLSVDHTMADLLRSRGAVVMAHDGWRVVRLLVGTGGGRPSWPGAHDRRILVERSGGRWQGEAAERAAGSAVLTCGGPSRGTCPALAGEPCSLAAGADVIVVDDSTPAGVWRDLVAAHAALHPGVDVFVTSACQAAARPA